MCYGRIFEKKDTERPRVLSFFMFCVCVCRAAIVLYVYKGLVLIEDQTHRCHHRYIVIEKGITKILAEFVEREKKKIQNIILAWPNKPCGTVIAIFFSFRIENLQLLSHLSLSVYLWFSFFFHYPLYQNW